MRALLLSMALLFSPAARAGPDAGAGMQLRSTAFLPGGAIPRLHTCEGRDVAPALTWSGVPPGSRALVLIVSDPDAPDPKAPKRTWVHEVLYDLPPTSTGLSKGHHDLPRGTRRGKNDWGRAGWGGPCPPIGRHRYFFELYALDAPLGELSDATKAAVEGAMKSHALAHAELIGTYQKGD